MAVGTGSSSKAGLNSFYRRYNFCSLYGFYSPVYHYLSEVDHAAEGVVEELVIASDEAKSRFDSPTAF